MSDEKSQSPQLEKKVAKGKGPVLPPDDLLALSPVWFTEADQTEMDRGGGDPRRQGKGEPSHYQKK